MENRAKLGEAQSLQQFSRDVDEMEIWITERTQMALDESYKDPANIQAKHQKHQAFEAELAANKDRIGSVIKMGSSKSWLFLFACPISFWMGDSKRLLLVFARPIHFFAFRCGISPLL